MMVVAGVGFRRGAPAAEIVGLVERALACADLDRPALRSLATAGRLADAEGFREAARHLAVATVAVDEAALAGAGASVRTRSERSLAAHGVGSVAEAAALGAAGPGATLVLPRIASAAATCALARGRDERP